MNISFPSTSDIKYYQKDNDQIIENISVSFLKNNIIQNTLLGKLIKLLCSNEKISKREWKILINYIHSVSKENFNNIKIIINNLVYTSNEFIWMKSNIKSFIQNN
jgi:hypothetical protein